MIDVSFLVLIMAAVAVTLLWGYVVTVHYWDGHE